MNKGQLSSDLLSEYRADLEAARQEARQRREDELYDDEDVWLWDLDALDGEDWPPEYEEEPCPYCGHWSCICYDDLYDFDPHEYEEIHAMVTAPMTEPVAEHYQRLWSTVWP